MPRHISMVVKPTTRRVLEKRKPVPPSKSQQLEPAIVEHFEPPVPVTVASDTPITPFEDELSSLPYQDLPSPESDHKEGLGTAYPSSEALPLLDIDTAPRKPHDPAETDNRRTSFSQIGLWREGVSYDGDGKLEVPRADPDQDDAQSLDLQLLSPTKYDPSAAAKPSLSVVIPPGRRNAVETLPSTHHLATSKSIVSRYNPSAPSSLPSGSSPPPMPLAMCAPSQSLPGFTSDGVPSISAVSERSLISLYQRTPSPAVSPRPQTSQSRPSHSSVTSSGMLPSELGEDASRNYTSSRTSLDSAARVDEDMHGALPAEKSNFTIDDTPTVSTLQGSVKSDLNKALPPCPGSTAETLSARKQEIEVATLRAASDSKRDSAHDLDAPPQQFSVAKDFDGDTYRQSCDFDESGPPSPTFTEAVFDLQTKLGQLGPLETRYSSASTLTIPYTRASVLSQNSSRESAIHHLPPIEQVEEDDELVDRFDADAEIAVKSKKKSSKRKLKKQRSAVSISSTSPCPATPSRPRSTSDLTPLSAFTSPVVRFPVRRLQTKNIDAAPDQPLPNVADVLVLPIGNGRSAETEHSGQSQSDLEDTPQERSIRSHSASEDTVQNDSESEDTVPQMIPRMPSRQALRVQSARLSVMVPLTYIDHGLIPVDDAVPDLPDIKLNTKTGKSSAPRAAELVLLRIMASLPSLRDLCATSMINKGMRRVYHQNELYLLKAVLENNSLPEWELREWTAPMAQDSPLTVDQAQGQGYDANSYRQAIIDDRQVVRKLKDLILDRCETFLRKGTVNALSAKEGPEVTNLNNAFFRIWSFCKIFGGDRGRDDDVTAQIDWLKGGLLAHQDSCEATVGAGMDFGMSSVLLCPPEHFGVCNVSGLDSDRLFDMTELWNCLAALLQNYQGAMHSAHKYGVFNRVDASASSDPNKQAIVVEEWIFYVMSFGPRVILELAQWSHDVDRGFEYAHTKGWTDWTPPSYTASRSTFLKEPVSRLYEERIASKAPQQEADVRPGNDHDEREASRRRVAGLAREIRMARCKSNFQRLPLIDMSLERPWSIVSEPTGDETPVDVEPIARPEPRKHVVGQSNAKTSTRAIEPIHEGHTSSTTSEDEDETSPDLLLGQATYEPPPAKSGKRPKPSTPQMEATSGVKLHKMGFSMMQARAALRVSN